MENTKSMSSWRWDHLVTRPSEKIERWNTSSPTYSYSKVTCHGTAVVCYRSNRRERPLLYILPRYSTSSRYMRFSIAETRPGQHRSNSSPAVWYTNRKFYAEDNLYSTATLVLSKFKPSGMQSVLENKMIDEIMSGKGQLANDLLEVSKTQAMFVDALKMFRAGLRDVRRGQPFSTFARTLKKEGWNGVAGKRFLEFTYGWAPTIKGAFETADALGRDFLQGKVQLGRVSSRSTQDIAMTSSSGYANLTGRAFTSGHLTYQYTVRNAKLALLSNLGLTNPAAIIWEATPWSFVFDWAFGFGSYLSSLDWDLGLSDIYYQTGVRRKAVLSWTTVSSNQNNLVQGTGVFIPSAYDRSDPQTKASYSWRGLKNPFASKNSGTRLAVSLALLDQQRTAIRRA